MSTVPDGMVIGDILRQAISELESAGIIEARIDAELLLGFSLGKTRTGLYLAARDNITTEQAALFQDHLSRRAAREPVAYIIGEREFWSLSFAVSPAVLIPRPETEFLLEVALARKNPEVQERQCLDLCCGSGVIAIVLARELARVVVALDISMAALKVARSNCRRHGVDDRVALVRGDLGCCFSENEPFSLIVSNPPYIRRDEIDDLLEPEVSRHEPRLALDGGVSGLDSLIRITDMLPRLLCRGGDAFFEIGDQQGRQVQELFLGTNQGCAYAFADIIKDYTGRDRVIHVRKS